MAAEPLTHRFPLPRTTSLRLWAALPRVCTRVCVCLHVRAILCLSHMLLSLWLLTGMMSPPREASPGDRMQSCLQRELSTVKANAAHNPRAQTTATNLHLRCANLPPASGQRRDFQKAKDTPELHQRQDPRVCRFHVGGHTGPSE